MKNKYSILVLKIIKLIDDDLSIDEFRNLLTDNNGNMNQITNFHNIFSNMNKKVC
jgi:hypothetical protein